MSCRVLLFLLPQVLHAMITATLLSALLVASHGGRAHVPATACSETCRAPRSFCSFCSYALGGERFLCMLREPLTACLMPGNTKRSTAFGVS